jgi:hypothetical protein
VPEAGERRLAQLAHCARAEDLVDQFLRGLPSQVRMVLAPAESFGMRPEDLPPPCVPRTTARVADAPIAKDMIAVDRPNFVALADAAWREQLRQTGEAVGRRRF